MQGIMKDELSLYGWMDPGSFASLSNHVPPTTVRHSQLRSIWPRSVGQFVTNTDNLITTLILIPIPDLY